MTLEKVSYLFLLLLLLLLLSLPWLPRSICGNGSGMRTMAGVVVRVVVVVADLRLLSIQYYSNPFCLAVILLQLLLRVFVKRCACECDANILGQPGTTRCTREQRCDVGTKSLTLRQRADSAKQTKCDINRVNLITRNVCHYH